MVPLFMIVTEIAFLRHCCIKPEHRKRNSQPHSEYDGPWPKNTPAVLAALAAHCTKAKRQ